MMDSGLQQHRRNSIAADIYSDDSGFTLLEILVASAIASMILVMAYASYHSIIMSVKRSTGHAEFYENVNLAITKIDMDIANTYYTRNNKRVNFVCEDSQGNSKLNFVTITHNDENYSGSLAVANPSSDVHEVGYYLKENPNTPGLYFLIKREETHYDDDPLTGGTENMILVNVVNVKFEFLRGYDWNEGWDSRENHMYPRAVKTTLVVKDYQAKEEKFQFETLINIREFK